MVTAPLSFQMFYIYLGRTIIFWKVLKSGHPLFHPLSFFLHTRPCNNHVSHLFARWWCPCPSWVCLRNLQQLRSGRRGHSKAQRSENRRASDPGAARHLRHNLQQAIILIPTPGRTEVTIHVNKGNCCGFWSVFQKLRVPGNTIFDRI